MSSKEDKVALLTRWKKDYSPTMVDELVRVAKHPEARDKIAKWNVDNFDMNRLKTKR
jgi:hypothetical protein